MSFSERDKLKALAIVHIFETSKPMGDYSAVAVLNDGAGVSYGISQFTHRSGSLYLVLARYLTYRRQGTEIFQAAVPDLRSRQNILKWAENIPFKNALRAAGRDPLMQQAQREIAFEKYLKPAIDACEGSDFEMPLSLAVIYDSINHGSYERIRDRVRFERPGNGSITAVEFEKEWITEYVKRRDAWLESVPRLAVTDYRTDFFLAQIARNNWELNLPVSVHGYRLTDEVIDGLLRQHTRTEVAEPLVLEIPPVEYPATEAYKPRENAADIPQGSLQTEAQPQMQATGDVTMRKERPSSFVKIGAVFTTVLGFFTTVGINLQAAFDRAATEITGKQLVGVLVGLAIGAGGLWLYDRSAERANRTNLRKLDAAADPGRNNVELEG